MWVIVGKYIGERLDFFDKLEIELLICPFLCYALAMIQRQISNQIQALSKKFPVVAVLGPRQSGKTTLVKTLFKEKPYVSLENFNTREFSEKDPEGFFARYPYGAIFDEIQKSPKLLSYMQGVVDTTKKNGQFIITGSQNILLHSQISQSLAGRVALFKLLPFSLKELMDSKKYAPKTANDYLFKGSYPRIYDQAISPKHWYPGYIETYIDRDVRSIKNISDLKTFKKFTKLCAGHAGQILNFQSLGNDCGVSYHTVQSWLSVLETSYIVFILNTYYKNFNKRLIKSPKLYFYDTGLLSSLLGLEGSKSLENHYMKGALFENFVIAEVMKNSYNLGRDPNLYFWRDKTGHEIDLMIEKEKLELVEIKAGQTVNSDFFKNLRYFQKTSQLNHLDSKLIYGGEEAYTREGIEVLGWKEVQDIF